MGTSLTAIVEAHLLGCLPPDVPPSYREITGVRQLSDKRKRRVIEADLVMFDGESAKVRVTEHRMVLGEPIWSHRWVMERAVYWEDGAWHRDDVGAFAWDTVSPDIAQTLLPMSVQAPEQMSLFDNLPA